jgi:hypothetical protein
MNRLIKQVHAVLLSIAVAPIPAWAESQRDTRPSPEPNTPIISRLDDQREATYMDKPLSYWLRSIQKRDEDMERAFDAIRALGPAAHAAVPELTRIVGEPFLPVHMGVDEPDAILAKVFDIQLRGDAIDALTAIGQAAAPSSMILIQWALTVRVIPGNGGGAADDPRFIDLMAIDILERMRVAAAIGRFGPGSASALAALLASADGEGRKLVVAILGEKALPIAVTLLKSEECEERKLGVAMLVAMWPVVPREHLFMVEKAALCDQTERQTLPFGANGRAGVRNYSGVFR